MQHGKKPTKNQKIFMKQNKLISENWLVERDTPEYMIVINRQSEKTRKILKSK